MIFSRSTLFSLGISVLGCILLFLYFRNKISTIEKKVNIIFDLIQNHQSTNSYPNQLTKQAFIQKNAPKEEKHTPEEKRAPKEKNTQEFEHTKTENLIKVSDDEDDNLHLKNNKLNNSSDSDSGSDSDSDSDSEYSSNDSDDSVEVSDNENTKINILSVSKHTLEEHSIEPQINGKPLIIPPNLNEVNIFSQSQLEEITDSLDDVKLEEEEEEEESEEKLHLKNLEIINDNTKQLNLKNINLTKEPNTQDNIFNYKKFKVPELRALAEEKGLKNYKSLKKPALIELLETNQ